jgi:thiamine-phosphate pyrophosphorylase
MKLRIREALDAVPPGGLALWFRDRDLPARDRRRLGESLAELAHERGAPLWVSEDAVLAEQLGASALQLPTRAAPERSGLRARGMELGRAAHDAEAVDEAAAQALDRVVLSPVFPVPGKGTPLGLPGLALLAERARRQGLSTAALGGIDASNAGQAFDAGVDAVAFIRAVLAVEEPARAAESLWATVAAARRASIERWGV